MSEAFKNVVSAFTGIFLVLLAGEIYFRFADPHHQLEFIVDEEVYYIHAPNQTGKVLMGGSDFWSPEVTINSDSLRGEELRAGKPAARILFLGDSLTFGHGVEDEETTPFRLNVLLGKNDYEVINGGVPGWGVFQMQRYLHRLAPKTEPDIVVLIYSEGDEVRQPIKDKAKEEKYLADQAFRKRIRNASKFVTWIYRKAQVFKLRHADKGNQAAAGTPGSTLRKTLISSDLERITEIKRICDSREIKFLLIGWLQENQSMIIEKKHTTTFKTMLEEFSVRNNVELLLVGDGVFAADYPPEAYSIEGDGHPTALAHTLSAKLIFDKLSGLGWLDASR